jgi:hypothetical protein
MNRQNSVRRLYKGFGKVNVGLHLRIIHLVNEVINNLLIEKKIKIEINLTET